MKYRELTILPGIKGFRVGVGCSSLYFSNWPELLVELENYFKDPIMTEKRFLDNDIRFGSIPLQADYAESPGGIHRIQPSGPPPLGQAVGGLNPSTLR